MTQLKPTDIVILDDNTDYQTEVTLLMLYNNYVALVSNGEDNWDVMISRLTKKEYENA